MELEDAGEKLRRWRNKKREKENLQYLATISCLFVVGCAFAWNRQSQLLVFTLSSCHCHAHALANALLPTESRRVNKTFGFSALQ